MTGRIYSVEEIKKIVSPIAASHGVEKLYLFGSYARGDADADSDMDFRLDKGQIKGLFALGSLYVELEDALGKRIDLLTSDSLDDEFRCRIASEEVLLYARK